MEDKQHLWDRFASLGEMIGDGLHQEPDGYWISRDYKTLMKILCPPSEEEKAHKAEIRRQKNEKIDNLVKTRLVKDKCSKCDSELQQTRKGSTVVRCVNEQCKTRYKYKVTTKRNGNL